MKVISYSKARNELAGIMQQVCQDHAPLIITRQHNKEVVLMSLEDYNALQETFYLLKSPDNARRIYEALEDLDTGKNFVKIKLED